MAELRRTAKRIRAAATDDAEKDRRAHDERDVRSGTDPETGKGHINISGPCGRIAQLLAFLEPWVQAEFERARTEGRKERRGAYLFDALLAALAAAAGNPDGDTRVRPPATILARVDVPALRRGHTIAGETCEIDGLGPVPVAALLDQLPDAAIYLICTNGVDVFNVTNLARKTTAHQDVVLWWLGVECARQGCGATRNLQIDHRLDWAHTHVTELRALDWLCTPDHRRKTYEGWALVDGRGRRPMVPPDDPRHPKNANAPPGNEAA
jgi:hypothetical protein